MARFARVRTFLKAIAWSMKRPAPLSMDCCEAFGPEGYPGQNKYRKWLRDLEAAPCLMTPNKDDPLDAYLLDTSHMPCFPVAPHQTATGPGRETMVRHPPHCVPSQGVGTWNCPRGANGP